MELPEQQQRLSREKNVFILCFDGTGNKFSGTEADSNILKLYRMVDRSKSNVYTFYQPGIGTYITSHSMQTTSMYGRVRSWAMKAKDSAVGSSFAEHVMGGYRFLMRYYSCEDDLYFFGFSRGAYTARFLAEMLDHVGLLGAGNEELLRFAWKTYAKWASRKNDGSPEAKAEEASQYEFMRGFRETFSRPVRRIRFLGLFDTVNSVPKFESAWMERSKFPYTARSSAKVIRHAVSIDERRAKFRQDLISGDRPQREDRMNVDIHRYDSDAKIKKQDDAIRPPQPETDKDEDENTEKNVFEEPRQANGLPIPNHSNRFTISFTERVPQATQQQSNGQIRLDTSHKSREDSIVGFASPMNKSSENLRNAEPWTPQQQMQKPRLSRRQFSNTHKQQDIEEVWFPGGHADIGGGWARTKREKWMLSHTPLVWMVHEAQEAGLEFDPIKVYRANCHHEKVDEFGQRQPCEVTSQKFYGALNDSLQTGVIHDCLVAGEGLPRGTVMMWNIMEYLPFRRMDLRPDGSWKAIRWPLPMGETRDIPKDAQIHVSAIKRMEQDPTYRPGNLIIGGGGRGKRTASAKDGTGHWKAYKNEGSAVTETWVRATT